MKVRTWNVGPTAGTWNLEQVRTYHLQSIAGSLADIAESLRVMRRQTEITSDAYGRQRRSEVALRFVVEQEEVRTWFEHRPHMPLTVFRERARRAFGWYIADSVIDAIDDVPFLRLDSVGGGYRVTLVD